MIKKSIIALCFSVLVPLFNPNPVQAFTIGKSPNHPERKWKVLETEHFLIHYYPSFEGLAHEASHIAEESYNKVTKDLNAYPGSKIPIILTQDQFLNGYAEPIKNRIVLDPVLMKSSIIGARRFISHEFTHIITYEAFSTGVSISKLYGLGNVPTWFLEGVAQYEAEYWYPSYDRMLRLHTMERSILTPTERDAFTILGADEGAAGYNEGYALVKFIFENYGHDKLAKVLEEVKSNNIPLFMAIEKVIGKTFLVLEAEWRQNLEEKYLEQTKNKDQSIKGSEIVIKKETNEANMRPQISPDGKIFTYMSSQGKSGYVNIRGKLIGLMPIKAKILGAGDKSETKIAGERQDRGVFPEKDAKSTTVTGGVIDYAWSPDSSLIAYTSIAGDELGNADMGLGFTSIKLEKNAIKAKAHFDYDFAFYDKDDADFKNPLRLISSPAFSPVGRKLVFSATVNEVNNIYEIDLHDLDRKQKKVKATLVTNTKGYLYKDIDWSPNGKLLVANIYKPGDGGNLILIEKNTGKSTFITNDSVIYSNSDPSWTADSKKIYYSSDRNGIDNLYCYDLDTQLSQKLTDSYGGLEFPFIKDNYLYFVSFFAKGTDIKRVPVSSLYNVPSPQTEPVEVKEKLITAKETFNTKNYVPWLAPDLIMPVTGVDERGDQIGLQASFDDILEQHAVNVALVYGLLSSRLSYGLSYVNRMFDPLLAVQLSEFPSIAATQDGKNYYFQRVQGLNLFATRPFFNELSQEISNVGSLELGFNHLEPIAELVPKEADQKLVRKGWNNFIALGWRSEQISGGYTADIHPTNGYRFNLRIENANKLLQSEFEYTQFFTDIRRYLPLWNDHVLALRTSAEVSFGNTTPLLLGGPPVNLSIGIQDFLPLRGFEIAQFIGNRLVMGTAEYRFPIFKRLNTVLSGLYLDSVYGAVFVDVGDAWFDTQRAIQFNAGGGGELRFRVAVGNRSTLGAYVGIARKISEKGEFQLFNSKNQFYFGFANSF
jgi:dipeptidyl aminopeptidase/acylaminoacyl peptidase